MLVSPKALLFLLLLFGILFSFGIKNTPQDSSIVKNSTYWESRIEKLGIEKAYDEFKKAYKKYEFSHSAMHMFGQLMYDKVGVKSITYCDDSFGKGCYHGVFTAAVVDKGENIIEELEKECSGQNEISESSCQHGIGHGLLEYFGSKKISKALDICGSWGSGRKLFGCISGVFMEYYFPVLTVEDEENRTLESARKFDTNTPLSPCDLVVNRYQNACFLQIAEYLWVIYGGDYKKIGETCLIISDNLDRQTCFVGIGYSLVPYFDFNVEKISYMCSQMPGVEEEKWCRQGAERKIPLDSDKVDDKDILERMKSLGY